MIDGATSDEDKVAPVYKLEEICELLGSSHERNAEELCRCVSVISLQRETGSFEGRCNEAISSIFAEDNNPSKPSPADDLSKRIQGFGNTNFEMPSDDKKSFLSEVVGIGSASINQGISSFTQGHSLGKNDNGNYKSPTLRRSLTRETDHSDWCEPVELHNGTQRVSGSSASRRWGQDSGVLKTEITNGESNSNKSIKTREERLLETIVTSGGETIVTSGGVRLQPTRDAIQAFLVESAKLDALALSHALESKLLSPTWQVTHCTYLMNYQCNGTVYLFIYFWFGCDLLPKSVSP
ncbi:protein MODIFIED TRANSPORT TO THE VACUOLE 1-like [Hibiscus syriacus]|uniref:protein MODIFIED TRANSPORT TO THE VACUOLE 1-like n=1 Tax=Hibiscus syriacus TaxID=106335 RepID=UPI001924F3AE|nr:protein MODIFIED TRANSPORT TO THE VACUOLE 1-like [Hibiscus syriacus]